MPLTNAYTTLAALKQRLRIVGDDYDGRFEGTITTASRSIDQHTGRRFYAASETRYYTPLHPYFIHLPDDLLSVTTLKTDADGDRTYETTWSSATDYYLWPDNAALDGRPYEVVKADLVAGRYTFPLIERGVQLVGSFGYCASGSHPPAIEEACLRLSERLYTLSTAPLGVAGTPETGVIRIASDRDLMDLLWPYRRRLGFA